MRQNYNLSRKPFSNFGCILPIVEKENVLYVKQLLFMISFIGWVAFQSFQIDRGSLRTVPNTTSFPNFVE